MKLRRSFDNKDYTMIMLANGGSFRKKTEVDNGVRIIVKPSENEPDFLTIIEIEGEDMPSIDTATNTIRGHLFGNSDLIESLEVIEDEEVEHQNRRSALDGNGSILYLYFSGYY